MGNLDLYEKVRKVPNNAQANICGGRLKGMTDINPMWRIKTLTENFGACGDGWYPEIVRQWTEQGGGGEIAAFVEIKLHLKYAEEWGMPISATGGSALVAKEKNGLYTSDECFKMAYTDALSVACKMLGIGADVYWEKDNTKYSKPPKTQEQDSKNADQINKNFKPAEVAMITQDQIKQIQEACFATNTEEKVIFHAYKKESLDQLSAPQAEQALKRLNSKADTA